MVKPACPHTTHTHTHTHTHTQPLIPHQAAIIGSDVPGITPAAITSALDTLPSSPSSPPASLVLGPALDGGYWLVACTAAPPTLFAGARWSTANAAADTRAAAAACGVVVVDGDGGGVPTLADVDTVQVRVCVRERRREGGVEWPRPPVVSVEKNTGQTRVRARFFSLSRIRNAGSRAFFFAQ